MCGCTLSSPAAISVPSINNSKLAITMLECALGDAASIGANEYVNNDYHKGAAFGSLAQMIPLSPLDAFSIVAELPCCKVWFCCKV